MQNWQKNGLKEYQLGEETQPFLKHLRPVLIQVLEIFIGMVILVFVVWTGNQAWQNPLIFNIPMLVFSLAALGGGLLFLWLIDKHRNSSLDG